MKIDSAKIEALRELLAAPHRKIVLVAHTNPDGDAIGASTRMARCARGDGA